MVVAVEMDLMGKRRQKKIRGWENKQKAEEKEREQKIARENRSHEDFDRLFIPRQG
jgi:hypothetical protein